MTGKLVEIRNLRGEATTDAGRRGEINKGISHAIAPGEHVPAIGGSGFGSTVPLSCAQTGDAASSKTRINSARACIDQVSPRRVALTSGSQLFRQISSRKSSAFTKMMEPCCRAP